MELEELSYHVLLPILDFPEDLIKPGKYLDLYHL